MKFQVIRYLKSLFIRLHLHILFKPFAGMFLQIVYMTRLSEWANKHKNLPGNDFYSRWDYNKRFIMYQNLIQNENLTQPINYLEFGVADGYSFNWWMTKNDHSESRFYGFDTFTGLPEDFGPYKKGSFNSGNIPVVKDGR